MVGLLLLATQPTLQEKGNFNRGHASLNFNKLLGGEERQNVMDLHDRKLECRHILFLHCGPCNVASLTHPGGKEKKKGSKNLQTISVDFCIYELYPSILHREHTICTLHYIT